MVSATYTKTLLNCFEPSPMILTRRNGRSGVDAVLRGILLNFAIFGLSRQVLRYWLELVGNLFITIIVDSTMHLLPTIPTL